MTRTLTSPFHSISRYFYHTWLYLQHNTVYIFMFCHIFKKKVKELALRRARYQSTTFKKSFFSHCGDGSTARVDGKSPKVRTRTFIDMLVWNLQENILVESFQRADKLKQEARHFACVCVTSYNICRVQREIDAHTLGGIPLCTRDGWDWYDAANLSALPACRRRVMSLAARADSANPRRPICDTSNARESLTDQTSRNLCRQII